MRHLPDLTIDTDKVIIMTGMLTARRLAELTKAPFPIDPGSEVHFLLGWAEGQIVQHAAQKPDPVADWSTFPVLTVSKKECEAICAHACKIVHIGRGVEGDFYMVAGFNFCWAMCLRIPQERVSHG